MTWIVIGIGLGWLVCGVLNYGLEFAYWQREWPLIAEGDHKHDRSMSILCSVLGPIALFVALMMGMAKHGFKWR